MLLATGDVSRRRFVADLTSKVAAKPRSLDINKMRGLLGFNDAGALIAIGAARKGRPADR
jgi:hypothetical protein